MEQGYPRQEEDRRNDERISKIIHRVYDLSLKELRELHNADTSNMELLLSGIIEAEEYDPVLAENITFLELMGLILKTKGNAEYQVNTDRKRFNVLRQNTAFYYLCIYRTVCFLLDEQSSCIPIKLLLSLEMVEWIPALARERKKIDVIMMMRDIEMEVRKLLNIDSQSFGEITLGEVLCGTKRAILSSWSIPTESINEFQERVIGSYDLMGKLLLSVFCKAFPEITSPETLDLKYKKQEWFWNMPFEDGD